MQRRGAINRRAPSRKARLVSVRNAHRQTRKKGEGRDALPLAPIRRWLVLHATERAVVREDLARAAARRRRSGERRVVGVAAVGHRDLYRAGDLEAGELRIVAGAVAAADIRGRVGG